jgi:hypothetical protein
MPAPSTVPSTLPEILEALAAGGREIEAYFLALPNSPFFDGDATHWGPAHHLSHLTIGHKRVARGLGSPALLPANPRGRSRNFEEIRDLYRTGLPLVPKEKLLDNPLPPKLEPGATQADVVAGFVTASAKLREVAATWNEAESDARSLPHPFLGLLSVREMLFFFVVHDRHHLDGVRARFDAPGAR